MRLQPDVLGADLGLSIPFSEDDVASLTGRVERLLSPPQVWKSPKPNSIQDPTTRLGSFSFLSGDI